MLEQLQKVKDNCVALAEPEKLHQCPKYFTISDSSNKMNFTVTLQLVIDMSQCNKGIFVCKLVIYDYTTMQEHLGNKNYGGYFLENFHLPFDPKYQP